MAVLAGKSYWATISSPNTTFEPVWQIDLAVEGAELEKAKEMSLTIMNKDDDRGSFVIIKCICCNVAIINNIEVFS